MMPNLSAESANLIFLTYINRSQVKNKVCFLFYDCRSKCWESNCDFGIFLFLVVHISLYRPLARCRCSCYRTSIRIHNGRVFTEVKDTRK